MNRTQWVVLLAVVVLMFAAIGACLAGRCTGNKPPAELSDLTVGRIGIPEVPKLPGMMAHRFCVRKAKKKGQEQWQKKWKLQRTKGCRGMKR